MTEELTNGRHKQKKLGRTGEHAHSPNSVGAYQAGISLSKPGAHPTEPCVQDAAKDDPPREGIEEHEREEEERSLGLKQYAEARVPRVIEHPEQELRTVERGDGDEVEEEEDGVDLEGKPQEEDEEVVRGERRVLCDRANRKPARDEREEIRERTRERNHRGAPPRSAERADIERHGLPPPKPDEEEREEPDGIHVREWIQREPPLIARGRIAERGRARRVRVLMHGDRDEDREDPRDADHRLGEEIERHNRS